MLKRLIPVAATLLLSVAPALAGFWEGTWVLRPADDGDRNVLVVEVLEGTVSWWIPDEATMHRGEAVEMSEETLALDVGAPHPQLRISLRATGANSAVGQSDTRDTSVPSAESAVSVRATRQAPGPSTPN